MFRKYPSYVESLSDYAELIRSKPQYYTEVWRENTDTYVDACDALQGTYATSSTYSNTLQTTIDRYDLTRFDEPLDYDLADESVNVSSGQSNKVDMKAYVDLERCASLAIGMPFKQKAADIDEGFSSYPLFVIAAMLAIIALL